MLLELAIWKANIIKPTDGNIGHLSAAIKMECQIYFLLMFIIIVPNVLSFLTDGNASNDVVDGNGADNGNGSLGQ